MRIINQYVLQAEAGTESDGGATGTEGNQTIPTEKAGGVVPFSPASTESGVGLFKVKAQREAALALELQQEADGGATIPADPAPKEGSPITKVIEDSNSAALDQVQGKMSNTLDTGSEGGLFYGGNAVQITNSKAVTDAFTEKKIDINKVNGELFSEKGLSAETRAVLNAAFGEGTVTLYLEGWKNKNDAAVEKSNLQNEKIHNQVTGIIEKETHGKLKEVMGWADSNLKPAEYEEYRTIINGNNPAMIRIAIRELTGRSGIKAGTPTEEKKSKPRFLEGRTGVEGEEAGISHAEYIKAFTSGKYKGKENYYDQLRIKGQRAGK